ncbi:MAG: N-acetyltransferase [Bacteroidota bacterium]|nr:N-acetyltransferase [Bacteroidota bacterium]MDP4205854.1 N-acetyltransferase [Bacteroidota bacterium]
MKIQLREEREEDLPIVKALIEKAFDGLPFSDGTEGRMVERIHKAPYFIPELSIVAICDDQIVGHILFTPVKIKGEHTDVTSLALAPMSVLPGYQKQGIGKALIKEGIKVATKLNFDSIVVLGHAEYYPKFGFRNASHYGVLCPLDVPDDYFMVLELNPGSLNDVFGMVVYPEEFFE